MRPVFEWHLRTRCLQLGKRTLIMGVVNVTPDSFSDSGLYLNTEHAVEHALELLNHGADIIDVGGESTRPGARVWADKVAEGKKPAPTSENPLKQPVTEKEETERVIPVISSVKQKRPEAIISVDTYKASVARAAVEAGAEIVNDISGFRWDAEMAETLASLRCGAVLMHTRGRPEEWRSLPPVQDMVMLVKRELRDWSDAARVAGVKRDHLVLDPGFGFGKSFQENYPLLAGVSRKSFIGRALARDGKDADIADRAIGTLAAETALILKGVHIVRTHDVRTCMDAAKIADVVVS
ncbi:MAG TPA: dihydropteroate synthase [Terriglobales bacterium]|nr:dihydropteroate synthase [Terriglobales bacterium]